MLNAVSSVLLIAFCIYCTRTQNSPVNIDGQQFEMACFIDSGVLNFTARVYTPYYLITLRFNNKDYQTNYFLQLQCSNESGMRFQQMEMASGVLTATTSPFFVLNSSLRAEGYNEYRFYYVINSTRPDMQVNMLFQMDIFLNATNDLKSFKESRFCYFHTYLQSLVSTYILLPQNIYAGTDVQTNGITFSPKVFLNSIQYQAQQVLMVALLILNSNKHSLTSLWAGFSYSNSHIYRDMVLVEFYLNGSANITDCFSLFAASPYSDTSVNIGGKENIVTISLQQGMGYSLAFFTRPFNTGDSYGDETLTKKINQKYSLALYTNSPTSDAEFKDKKLHNYLHMFNPNLNLHANRIIATLMMLFALLAL